jgi:DNA-damage-inducible protein J
MNATTNVSIRMDVDLKKQAEELFADLGLNMTSAMTMFLKQAVRNQGIPFEISRIPNTTAALKNTRVVRTCKRSTQCFSAVERSDSINEQCSFIEHTAANAETLSAMLESERIAHDPNVKGYTNLNELFKELKA